MPKKILLFSFFCLSLSFFVFFINVKSSLAVNQCTLLDSCDIDYSKASPLTKCQVICCCSTTTKTCGYYNAANLTKCSSSAGFELPKKKGDCAITKKNTTENGGLTCCCQDSSNPATISGTNTPDTTAPVLDTEFNNPLATTDDVNVLVGKAVKIVLGLIGSLALLLFIYAGFTWMTSAGDSKKIETSKEILVWTSAGMVVIISSYLLVNFIIKNISA